MAEPTQEILRKLGSNHTTCCVFDYNTLVQFEDDDIEEITYVGVYTFQAKVYCITNIGDISFNTFDEQDQIAIADTIISGKYELSDSLQ